MPFDSNPHPSVSFDQATWDLLDMSLLLNARELHADIMTIFGRLSDHLAHSCTTNIYRRLNENLRELLK